MLPDARRWHRLVEARFHHLLWNPRGRSHPRTGQGLHFDQSSHVKDVVTSAQEGGASLGILSGFVAGNFSAYWLGLCMVALMARAISSRPASPWQTDAAPAVFAFGLVAFGFLGMGPVTIAVDSYGPVTDNAQSVYELSLIELCPASKAS